MESPCFFNSGINQCFNLSGTNYVRRNFSPCLLEVLDMSLTVKTRGSVNRFHLQRWKIAAALVFTIKVTLINGQIMWIGISLVLSCNPLGVLKIHIIREMFLTCFYMFLTFYFTADLAIIVKVHHWCSHKIHNDPYLTFWHKKEKALILKSIFDHINQTPSHSLVD